jgi:hypothetical protein
LVLLLLLAAERTVLYGAIAVLSKGLWEVVGGCGRMGVRRVVDVWEMLSLIVKGLTFRFLPFGMFLLPRNLIIGCRCAKRALVNRIVFAN